MIKSKNKIKKIIISISILLIIISILTFFLSFLVKKILLYENYINIRNTNKSITIRNASDEDSILNKIDHKAIIDNLSNINLEEYFNLERITEYAKGIIGFATTIFDVFVTIIVSMYLLAERSQIVRFAKRLCGAIFNINIYNI